MNTTVRYLTHPQVLIEPNKDIQGWYLNDVGKSRVEKLAMSGALIDPAMVISSAETKALETARPLAKAARCELWVRERMHENDRSSTGFLPPAEFVSVVDQFFANPKDRIRGWEAAAVAQARIVEEVQICLGVLATGDILFVGHGGVGTLLFCHFSGVSICRIFDQGVGGGCYFEFEALDCRPKHGWRPMEELSIGRGVRRS